MYVKNGICYAGEIVDSIKLLDFGMMMIKFSTGETRLFDITSLLDKGKAYEPLAEEINQKTATVTHGFVSWMNGEIDIAPETMYKESFKYNNKFRKEFLCLN